MLDNYYKCHLDITPFIPLEQKQKVGKIPTWFSREPQSNDPFKHPLYDPEGLETLLN